MFENVGGKIKTFVEIFYWLIVVIAIFCGIALCVDADDNSVMIAIGLALIFGTPILMWIRLCLLAALGELCENVYLLKKDVESLKGQTERNVTENLWVCPRCGTKNPKFVGTCGCGYSKSRDTKPIAKVESNTVNDTEKPLATETKVHSDNDSYSNRIIAKNEWFCPKCKTINLKTVRTCSCGYTNPKLSGINANIEARRNTEGIELQTSSEKQVLDTWVCPECETKNPLDSSFCGKCGRKKEDNSSEHNQETMEAETEQVAVDEEERSLQTTKNTTPVNWFCIKCGTKNVMDGIFCCRCGWKRKDIHV